MRRSSTSTPIMSIRGGTPLSRSTTPDPMHRSFPTKTEWESWKETIRALYIERNMTLSRLRDHMAQVHGFHAEDHEYKRRLSQWRFRKNYTSAEKEAVATHLDNYRAHPQHAPEPDIRLNNMPLRLDKIERHRKATRKKSNRMVALQFNTDPSPEPEADFSMSMRDDSHLSMSDQPLPPSAQSTAHAHLMSTSTPQYAFPMDHSESMMWHVDQFDPAQRDTTMMMSASMSLPTQGRLDVAMFNIVKAVDVFGAGNSASAKQTVDECCNSVQDLLQTDTWSFMLYITVLQTLPAWNQAHYHAFYNYLFRYLAGMSFQVLGQGHAVTNYFRSATNFDARQASLERACLLVLEMSGQSSSMRGRDQKVEEMVRVLRDGWYSQNLEDTAVHMAKIKRSVEQYMRRSGDGLNTSSALPEDAWRLQGTNTSTTMEGQRYMDASSNPSSMTMMRTSMGDPRHYRPRGGH